MLVLLALATINCATIQYPDGTRQRIILPQVSSIVTVKNNCAPVIDVEGSEGPIMKGVRYSTSVTVPLISDAFTGFYREMFLTITAYRRRGGGIEYLGSATKTFSVATYSGTQRSFWIVDRLDSPYSAICQPSP